MVRWEGSSLCFATPSPGLSRGTQAKPALHGEGKGPPMPRPAGADRRTHQPIRASDNRAGKGAEAGILGCGGLEKPPSTSAPSGAGPDGAGEMAACHPTLGEQAAVAGWCLMELPIEVTSDILLWVGPREVRGEAGVGRIMSRLIFGPQLCHLHQGTLAGSLKPLCSLSLLI